LHDPLFELCRYYADAHADQCGIAVTPVRGLTIVRALHPGQLQAAVSRPLVAMLLQGRKRVTTSIASYEYGPGESMVIAADVPTVSQITQASIRSPYYSLVLELDIAIVRELQDVVPAEQGDTPSVRIEPFDADVADAAYRLVRLLKQHEAIKVLGDGLLRELHYWLLRSVHGSAIRALGAADSYTERVSRAVAILRKDFMRPIRIEELADAASMSVSMFHQHFRTITTLSPLQFQKQLRLIYARRLMVADGVSIAQAAYAVGYASVSQFTREYARMFEVPPGRDLRLAKAKA
jgi:AraC-like DNA-binding protein